MVICRSDYGYSAETGRLVMNACLHGALWNYTVLASAAPLLHTFDVALARQRTYVCCEMTLTHIVRTESMLYSIYKVLSSFAGYCSHIMFFWADGDNAITPTTDRTVQPFQCKTQQPICNTGPLHLLF